MKTTLLTLGLLSSLAIMSYARSDISVGLGFNTAPAPVYYSSPPPYYNSYADAYWMNTPVQVVYFHGVPRRMHYWHGRWYDESWHHRGYGYGHRREGWHDREMNHHRGWWH